MSAGRKFTLTQVVGPNLEGGQPPTPLMVTEAEQVIGRSERADYELSVPTVSRRHAVVWMRDGMPHIRDLDSGHGTFVNSTRIADPVALRQGDLVSLGQEVVLLVSAAASAEIDALEKAQLANEESVDTSLVELALTDAVPEGRYKSYFETLSKLTHELRGLSDPVELLSAVVARLPDVIACDRFLALTGGTPDELQITARKLRRPDDASHWHPPSKSILRRAMLAEKPILSFDAQTDKRFKGRQSVALSNVRSAICVAMRSAEGPQGVLYADTLANAGLHRMEDGDFMALVGHWLGARLREFRLQKDLEETRQALDDSTEQVFGDLTGDIKSHLNRLEMIADDAANERGQPGLANLLRAECNRLREDVDTHLNWSKHETTNPGKQEAEAPRPASPRKEDEEDRRLARAQGPGRAPTANLEERAIVDDQPSDIPARPKAPRVSSTRPLPGGPLKDE